MPPSTRDAGSVHPGRVEHPSAYADRLGAGDSPAYAREILDEETRRVERVLLEIRSATGCRRRRSTTPDGPRSVTGC